MGKHSSDSDNERDSRRIKKSRSPSNSSSSRRKHKKILKRKRHSASRSRSSSRTRSHSSRSYSKSHSHRNHRSHSRSHSRSKSRDHNHKHGKHKHKRRHRSSSSESSRSDRYSKSRSNRNSTDRDKVRDRDRNKRSSSREKKSEKLKEGDKTHKRLSAITEQSKEEHSFIDLTESDKLMRDNIIEAIDNEGFVQKSYVSSRSEKSTKGVTEEIPGDSFNFGTFAEIKSKVNNQLTVKDNENSLFSPHLFGSLEEREEKYLRKIFSMRVKAMGGEVIY